MAENGGVGGGAAAAAGPPAPDPRAAALALIANSGDRVGDRLNQLKQQKAELARKKKQVAKDLKNEEKRKKRLMDKAQSLSEADLVDILAAKANKGKGKGKG